MKASDMPGPAEFADDTSIREQLSRCMWQLPDNLRMALYDRFWEDKSYTEMGRDWNLTRQRMQQMVKAGLGRLRAAVETKALEGALETR